MNPHRAYSQQKSDAKRRDIPFNLTFIEWWDIWQKSGLYSSRGRRGYVMARIDPDGDYNIRNVEIIPARQVFTQAMDLYYGGERDYLV